MNQTSISFWQALGLAIGSVIGSGLLFLPTLTYSYSDSSVGYVWLISLALCIPLIFIFKKIVFLSSSSSGIHSVVSDVLGTTFGRFTSRLLFFTVILGMPASAVIVSSIVGERFSTVGKLIGVLIIGVSVVVNLRGLKLSSKFQILAICFLLALSFILFFSYGHLEFFEFFEFGPIKKMGKGVVISFWAFAGFENLSFFAKRITNSKRNYPLSMVLALLICGILYLGLTLVVAGNVSPEIDNSRIGIFTLFKNGYSSWLIFVVMGLAVLSVFINFISWIYGISTMIQSGAESGAFPRLFKGERNGIPRQAILLMASAFMLSFVLQLKSDTVFEAVLNIVSVNFVLVYILICVSYLKASSFGITWVFALVILAIMLVSIVSMKYYLLYPLAVMTLSLCWDRFGKSLSKIEYD